VGDDAQHHARVLGAAVLGALAEVGAGHAGLEPHAVDAIGDDVGLAVELGDPEAVHDVGRLEGEEGGAADRNVQLVGGDHVVVRVAELPPPLVADDAHVQRVGGRGGVLDRDQRARGDQEEDEDDEQRDDRPGQLDLVAAVDLWRLAVLVARPPAEARHAVGQQPGDDHEDRRADAEQQQRQGVDVVRRRRERVEDARHRSGRGR
jgi:hypothetical protein